MKLADELRISRPVKATQEQHNAITRAITFWLARYGDDGPLIPESHADALVAICQAWRAREIESLNNGKHEP